MTLKLDPEDIRSYQAKRLARDNPSLHNCEVIARCYRLLGQAAEARDMFRRAAAAAEAAAGRQPDYPGYAGSAGNFYRLADRSDQGRPWLERAVALYRSSVPPGPPIVYLGRAAECLYLLGRYDDVDPQIRQGQAGDTSAGRFEIVRLLVQARASGSPGPAAAAAALAAELLRKGRLKPYYEGDAPMNLYDLYELGRDLEAELGGPQGDGP